MNEEQLNVALAEIDASTMTARQKIKEKATLMKDYRQISGESLGVVNRTSYGRTFGQSLARAGGRAIIKALFK